MKWKACIKAETATTTTSVKVEPNGRKNQMKNNRKAFRSFNRNKRKKRQKKVSITQ